MQQLDKILKDAKGKQIEIIAVHHVYGNIRASGILREITEDIITIEMEYRIKRLSLRKTPFKFLLNRNAASILSVSITE